MEKKERGNHIGKGKFIRIGKVVLFDSQQIGKIVCKGHHNPQSTVHKQCKAMNDFPTQNKGGNQVQRNIECVRTTHTMRQLQDLY